MRYWLHVHGAAPLPHGQPLRSENIGDTDEVLCGACQALLTVDHHTWVNSGGPNTPSHNGGYLSCQLCGNVNDTGWASTTPPRNP